jgi:hypothetical protein
VSLDPSDFTATNGTSVVLASGAAASDVLNIYAFNGFSVADTVSASTGGTFSANVAFAADATFGDNDKAIFGAGNDLQVFHDATDSHVVTTNGDLNLQVAGGGTINLGDQFGNTLLKVVDNADVKLYHGTTPSQKLATTSTGIDVTGSVTADELYIQSTSNDSTVNTIQLAPSTTTNVQGGLGVKSGGIIDVNGTNSVGLRVGGTRFVNVVSGGDISFYDSTGTTQGLFWDASTQRLGLGTTGPTNTLTVHGSSGTPLLLQGSGNDTAIAFAHSGTTNSVINSSSDGAIEFRVGGGGGADEVGRWDASGNLLVGATTATPAQQSSVAGISLRTSGAIETAALDGSAARFNRMSSDGGIVNLRKDGTTVGVIGANGGDVYIGTGDTTLRFADGDDAVIPRGGGGSARDNAIDLGISNNRFDDIYATNGTIQTSDQNEKQQIASLTDAEITAAKAISQLFKTFKWNDKVAAKGDAARRHTGVIAQDVEAAMTAAGLDAGDYAFFISTTWWEADGETYYNADDAPEGATEHNRKGIRYPELLSFVGAATEQRLANIETRLTALENA